MESEAFLKGRFAGIIVSLMLQEAGYEVINFGYEGLSDNLIQFRTSNKKAIPEILLTMPHFVVSDRKEGGVILVHVKYRNRAASGRNILLGHERLKKNWPEAILVVVECGAPYFSVVQMTKSGVQFESLEKRGYLKVNKATIKKFGLLARKYLL